MSINRRGFLKLMQAVAALGLAPSLAFAGDSSWRDYYQIPLNGNLRLLHLTDSHAQLLPVHFREPSVNIGVGDMRGRPPHLVGRNLLEYFDIPTDGRKAHAFTYLNFTEACKQYGRMGGFAYIKTIADHLRGEAGEENSLFLEGGDLWQGSGTAFWTSGQDMVGAANLLGLDAMTGHWEFAYPEEQIRKNIEAFKGEFLAQNVFLNAEAEFEGAPAFDEASGRVFKPYSIWERGGRRIGVIGQAFPYTPIANPSYFIPDWNFGIQEDALQAVVDTLRNEEQVDAIIVLSHNGMDVDLKLAGRISGIDAILGGHTHDAIPKPFEIKNSGGTTLVANGGASGKFLGVLDLDIGENGMRDYSYHLLPIFSELIEPDAEMVKYIEDMRTPFAERLSEELAHTDELLYRRGNFNGTMDQVICDALRAVKGAEIALSPGFRWGTTLLPGQAVTVEDVMDATAITYPETYVQDMTGAELKTILEDVCDNLFNKDPYYQQGGDMVRLGGMDYTCDPSADIGERITNMSLDNGKPIEADKRYKVAGWATVNSQAPGEPIWDVVSAYLRSEKFIRIEKLNTPKLKNIDANPGVGDYPF